MIKVRAIADARIEAHVIKVGVIKDGVIKVVVIKDGVIKVVVIKDGPSGASATRDRAVIGRRIANRGTRPA